MVAGGASLCLIGGNMEIISREDAKESGIKHFYTGVSCVKGHDEKRFTSDGSCMACRRENSLKWVNENRDRCREIGRISAKKRQPKRSEYAKEWSKKNREKLRLKERIDKQKRRSSGSLSKSDVLKILSRQKWKCAEPTCSADLKVAYHLDHIMPVALGGKTEKSNCQGLCPKCNQSKSADHPVDHARKMGRLL